MGWCSGTEIFDKIVGPIVESDLDNETKTLFVFQIVDALEDKDWDCQNSSKYYDNPIVQIVFRELHSDWFEDDIVDMPVVNDLIKERNELARLAYVYVKDYQIEGNEDFIEKYESGYYK